MPRSTRSSAAAHKVCIAHHTLASTLTMQQKTKAMLAKEAVKKDPDPNGDSESDVEHAHDFKATLTTKSDRMVRKIQCTIPGGTAAVVSPS